MSRVKVSFGKAARFLSPCAKGKESERMTKIASARGSAASVLVRISMKRLGLGPALLVEQFLALVDSENGRERRRAAARRLGDPAQGHQELGKPVLALFDELLNLGPAAR